MAWRVSMCMANIKTASNTLGLQSSQTFPRNNLGASKFSEGAYPQTHKSHLTNIATEFGEKYGQENQDEYIQQLSTLPGITTLYPIIGT